MAHRLEEELHFSDIDLIRMRAMVEGALIVEENDPGAVGEDNPRPFHYHKAAWAYVAVAKAQAKDFREAVALRSATQFEDGFTLDLRDSIYGLHLSFFTIADSDKTTLKKPRI